MSHAEAQRRRADWGIKRVCLLGAAIGLVLRASAPLREITCFLLLLTSLEPLCAQAEQQLDIRIVTDSNAKRVAVEAVGLSKDQLKAIADKPDEAWASQRLRVFVMDGDQVQRPAMAGRYAVVDDALRFTPQFAFRPGLKYQIEFLSPPTGSESSPARLTKLMAIPAPPPGEPTNVKAIYPSAAVLPENQLRFYLHFSAPMRQGEAYSHVKLLKSGGEQVTRAFLEIGEELWDTTGTRLTLLFDPGRVKQGLKPREEFGPVLVAGQEYKLVIDKAWRDATGRPLAAGLEKRFKAGPMIDAAIDHKQWKLSPPAAATRAPLVVQFSQPLDRALLEWTITVEDAAGKAVSGDVTVADEERRWEFRPDQAWQAGQYSLAVDTTLEDSAGNNLSRPFEVDVFRPVERQIVAEYVRLRFRIASEGGSK
jgi:Bacterial Ig-like domain